MSHPVGCAILPPVGGVLVGMQPANISVCETAMTRMPFGKYTGWWISTIPTDYLNWLLRECDLSDNVFYGAVKALRDRGEPVGPPNNKSEKAKDLESGECVSRWYQKISKEKS